MDSVQENKDISVVAVTLALGGFLLLLYLAFGGLRSSQKTTDEEEEPKKETKPEQKTKSKKAPKYNQKSSKKIVSNFSDPLLHTTLKGHTGLVTGLDPSINGKYLATCADDRTVRLWSIKEFGKGNKFAQINIELDHAKYVRFSPDSRAFIAGLAIGNTVRVFKLGKKEDGSTTSTPLDDDFKDVVKSNLLNAGVGATSTGGSFVMTAYKDTTILVHDLKGHVLHTINTHQSTNYWACVSPCGRFIACSGWTTDVKVWEVVFSRTGEYKEVARAFELTGHSSSVWSFAFNNDSTKMISVSKDGTWRFYDTNIEYGKGQEPNFITSGKFDVCGRSPADIACTVALSPDARVAAVAAANDVSVFSTTNGEVSHEFREVHSEVISEIKFDIAGRYIMTCGDRFVRVFHNTLGYKELIRELEDKAKKQPSGSAMKARLNQQIEEAKKALKQINDKVELKQS